MRRTCKREHTDRGSLPEGGLFQKIKSRIRTALAREHYMAWRPFKRTSGGEDSHPHWVEATGIGLSEYCVEDKPRYREEKSGNN